MKAERAVVPHVDDLGASHGANAAFLDLARRGLVTCGSVMVPGAWFREIADAVVADRSLDVGVHLTLTSEWDRCRWAPISTASRASGLIDDDGYFWRDVDSLRRHLVLEAAELELRAQIERAVAAGIKPSHIDAHMGAAMLPGLLELQIRLGREYRLFPVLPLSITWAPNAEYAGVVAALAAGGAPVVDHCRGTLAVERGGLGAAWAEVVRGLGAGVTHLALHCTAAGDFAAMAPDHAAWRSAEYEWIGGGGLRGLLAEAGVAVVGTRMLNELWNQPSHMPLVTAQHSVAEGTLTRVVDGG